MVARELPPDKVLASWQHVEQRALDLRAADIHGTLQELRVQAYLDLLQERDSRCAPADRDASTGPRTQPTTPARTQTPAPPRTETMAAAARVATADQATAPPAVRAAAAAAASPTGRPGPASPRW